MSKPTILVIGATGAQGGSVASHLLRAGKFAVRAMTRRPDSEKAAALRDAGAEVVGVDLADPVGLRGALDGCHGCFGVTNFWEHFDAEWEMGRNLVDAVAASGVGHFVFSTLPNASAITDGELPVPHFDIKARLEEYARGLALPATYIHVAFYFENFLSYFVPQLQGDGTYAFGFPQGETPMAGVAVDDVGGVVSRLFEMGDEAKGRRVGIVGEEMPAAGYADVMRRILEREIYYYYLPREIFSGLGFPGAEDLANMFEFNRLCVPSRRDDLEVSRALYPALQSFDSWLPARAAEFHRLFATQTPPLSS